MPVVTALRARPRGRLAVELDGTAWRTLPAEPVLRAGLCVGRELDRPAARRLRRELRHAEALGIAAGSLRTRDLSSQGVEERLRRRRIAPGARKDALEALERAGLVDDRRFAFSRASALAARGYGDAAIAADLEARGVGPDLGAEALATLPGEPERARELARSRGVSAKTARFLAARGFGGDAVEAAFGADFANGP